MFVGYDPIMLEEHIVKDWLAEDPDNFVMIADEHAPLMKQKAGEDSEAWVSVVSERLKDKIFCLKKSYFLNPSENDYYVTCITKGGHLMAKESAKTKNFYLNLGPYMDADGMIVAKDLIRNLNKKQQIYCISEDMGNKQRFVGLTWLQLSTIGISKGDLAKQQKSNMPFKDDVYFEQLMASSLYGYSGILYQPINGYLRGGPDYWTSKWFIPSLWGPISPNKNTAIEIVKQKIALIDKCFLEAAPRLEDKKKVYFRGMKGMYDFQEPAPTLIWSPDAQAYKPDAAGPQKLPEVLVTNYTSVSTKPEQARRFASNVSKCCLFEVHLPEGMPHINMINTTKYKKEAEVLLPRNIIFTYKGPKVGKWKNFPVHEVHASFQTEDQFKIDDGCRLHETLSISVLPKNILTPKTPLKKKEKTKKTQKKQNMPKVPKGVPKIKMAPKDVAGDLEVAPLVQGPDAPEQAKKKRCPKGSRRNKKTGLCVKTQQPQQPQQQQQQQAVKPKTKRCPNGSRRNKKTKKCEPKPQ
jgi:hypothetical protein